MSWRCRAVDFEPPITDQISLLEYGTIRTEERNLLAALAYVENLRKREKVINIMPFYIYYGAPIALLPDTLFPNRQNSHCQICDN